MKIIAATILLTAALLAEPVTTFRRCPACNGEKSLSLTPPNIGQYDGEIGVTPGKPFASHRWDVRHAKCPLCRGVGHLEQYRLKAKPPEDAATREVCTACWWSGAEPCRKCSHTGFLACPRCKSPRLGSKPGWIATEKKTAGRTSQHKKLIVTACPDCGGLAKIVCPDCDGKGGQPCRRCKGDGSTPKKAK